LAAESRLKVGFILVFALLLWVGLFVTFLRSFTFIGQFPGLREVLLEHLFSLLFFSLLVMLTFSTGIISFGSLYRAPESAFLLAQPIRPETLFTYKFIESLVFSSWGLIFLGMPALLAYGFTGEAPTYFFPLSLVVFVPFAVVPAVVGAGVMLLVVRYLPRTRRGLVLWGALGAGALLVVGLYRMGIDLRGHTPFSEAWLWNVLKRFRFVRSSLLPSYWLTEGILALGRREPGRASFFFLIILSNAGFLFLLLYRFAGWQFLESYSRAQGLRSRRRRRRQPAVSLLVRGLFWYLDEPTRVLVRRDIICFLRDPVQWSQFLIFFGLLAIYFFNLRRFYYQVTGDFWRMLVSLLNLGATCLTLATFTSRFIYPQVSLEAQRMWVVGLAPVSRRKLLLAKFAAAVVGSMLLAGGLVTLSNWMLGMPVRVALVQLLVAVLVAAGLSGLAVGLGASYPNLRESDPSKIVAGFGGTFSLVTGLLFLTVMLVFAAGLTRLLFMTSSGPAAAGWAGAAMALTVLTGVAAVGVGVTVLPMALGLRRFERMEF
jgi:ABC-2 type transport system permease protein